MGEWMQTSAPPEPSKSLALFLDFDGTLVDIAPTPEAVVVPRELPHVLDRAATAVGGALAIVSGRKAADLRDFLSPVPLPYAAEHGAFLSLDGGAPAATQLWPLEWSARLQRFAEMHSGVLIEPKTAGVAIHYRKAPAAACAVARFAEELATGTNGFDTMDANMVVEIRRCDANKGGAIARFMATPPFAGRRPVFVADDCSDAAGFAAVEEMGGVALLVGVAFAGSTRRVRDWLQGFGELP